MRSPWSGAPSENFSVPIRVSTVSGVLIEVGTSAEIFGAGAFCPHVDSVESVRTAASVRQKDVRLISTIPRDDRPMRPLSRLWNGAQGHGKIYPARSGA